MIAAAMVIVAMVIAAMVIVAMVIVAMVIVAMVIPTATAEEAEKTFLAVDQAAVAVAGLAQRDCHTGRIRATDPTQATVIPLGLTCLSYVPTIQVAVGQISVLAPSERFTDSSFRG